MVSVLDEHPHVGLAYCQSSPVNAEGNRFDDNTYLLYTRDLDPNRWTRDFVNSSVSKVKKVSRLEELNSEREWCALSAVELHKRRLGRDHATALRGLVDLLSRAPLSGHRLHEQTLNYHRQHPKKVTDTSITNLVYFREFLQVQQYIFDEFQIEKDIRRTAAERFFREWRRLALSDNGRITIGGHLRTAFMARRQFPEELGP